MKKFSLLLAGLVLSVLTFAFGTNHGFNDVFGPLFHPAPQRSTARRPKAWARFASPLERDRD